MAKAASTPKQVADWMFKASESGTHWLYQQVAVSGIIDRFGRSYIYTNQNGNNAIDARVLMEFRKLIKNCMAWDRGSKAWRPLKS